MERVDTRVWELELTALAPGRALPPSARAEHAAVPFGPLNRWFYAEIGADFHWVDRLRWSANRWQVYAESVETWLLHEEGTPAGYAEVRAHGTFAAIEMFGLLAPFRGRGLGGAFLTAVTARALALAPLVKVNTCELDGPHALANYERRGFAVVRESVEPRGRLSP